MKKKAEKYLPFSLTFFLVVIDRISKIWIVKNVPINTIYKTFANDLIRIWHVRNTGIAFSLGSTGSQAFRFVFFTIFPLFVMVWLLYSVFKNKHGFTQTQRWFLCGIAGGGIGTIIDRILYFNEGVVDFISIKFFGIFGMERWPTFNISDACVVLFAILFAVSIFLPSIHKKKRNK